MVARVAREANVTELVEHCIKNNVGVKTGVDWLCKRVGKKAALPDVRTLNRRLASTRAQQATIEASARELQPGGVSSRREDALAAEFIVPLHATPKYDGRWLLGHQDTEELKMWLKLMNQFDQPQGFSEVEAVVMELLSVRDQLNRKSKYRRCEHLTKAGKIALQKGHISRGWFKTFLATNPDIRDRMPSMLDPHRAQWSTVGVRNKHAKTSRSGPRGSRLLTMAGT
jgi:hypothetical protein